MITLKVIALAVLVLTLASAGAFVLMETEESGLLLKNETLIQMFCIRESGSDAAYQKYLSTLGNLGLCILNLNDSSDISFEATSSGVIRIKNPCPLLNTSLPCFDGFKEAFTLCFREDSASLTGQVANEITSNLYNLMCGDASIYEEMGQRAFHQCVTRLWNELDECSGPSLFPKNSRYDNVCGAYKLGRECLQRKVNDCETQEVMKLVDAVLEPFNKFGRCMDDDF
ncbi:uncharacterized protein LOC129740999 [Uranotaenia lowii]|uniref:uncharacterized protein LOC129740999 n=1 Tax=Uranotaenia lowii TaxID=190385 RepID=UPI002478EF15|nr:uncharacterized protein LOC129740999 [Uranotaenia lowii]